MKDENCQDFVSQALHAGFDFPLDEADDVSNTCHTTYGQCEKDPVFHTTCKFVRAFNNSILQTKIKVGDLLHLTNPLTGGTYLFFLGVCLRRPTVHVLLYAQIGEDGLCRFQVEDRNRLKISTSCQLFREILSGPDAKPDKFQGEIWKYKVVLSHEAPELLINVSGDTKAFEIDTTVKYQPKKKHFKLPFGLRMPARKKTNTRGSTKKTEKTGKTSRKKRERTQETEEKKELVRISDSDNDDGVLISSASPSVPAGDASDDTGSVSGLEETETTDLNLSTISKKAQKEISESAKLIDQHEEQVAEVDVRMSQPNPSQSSGSRPAGSSFFSKSTGLEEVAVAVSGRAKCYHCKALIAKGSIRYSWFHSRYKPPVWLHSSCLPSISTQEDLVPQVVERLQWLSRQPRNPDETQSIQDTLHALQHS